jgi:hypothetical protein
MRRLILAVLLLILLFCLPGAKDSYAFYSDQEATAGNRLSTACWVAPTAPALLSPVDGTATNVSDITFSWGTSVSSCPTAVISYDFQLLTAADPATIILQPGAISARSFLVIGLAEGSYRWRVLVSDQKGNTSASGLYTLTIDKTLPAPPTLSITGSWTKVLEEKIVNGNFNSGLTGWTTAGDVAVLDNPDGGKMAQIGKPVYSDDEGNYVWENRLMQSFDSGAKSLALDYDFHSDDFGPRDDPGFFVRLNGQEVFSRSKDQANTGWQQFIYDLSTFQNQKINLAVYAGNTGSRTYQSWANVARISTYFVAAPAHATYTIENSETGPCRYKIDSADWADGSSFTGLAAGTHVIGYQCFDPAGNSSSVSSATIITDAAAPNAVTDLRVDSVYENTTFLAWTAPGNDGASGRAAQYDIRYSTSEITDDTSFNAATRVEKVPPPQEAGETENLEILGLNPHTTYYFALKAADEAPNWSGLSNHPSATTETSAAAINSGDIIINELMWSGTSVSDADQYLELRNMTDRSISLSGLTFTKYDNAPMNVGLAGKSIPAHGYFLIANGNSYTGGDSQLKIAPDLWDSSLDLVPDHLHIKLLAGSTLIDEAWNDSAVTEGMKTGGKYYSMERTSVPGNGASPLSWYTCIDAASTAEFFDGGADERGTPGAENRSENEPFIKPIPAATTSAQTVGPSLALQLSEDGKSVAFELKNAADYLKVKYELTYDTDAAPQGVLGEADLPKDGNFRKEGILLGTCSTGGTCVYQTGVKNIHLKLNMISAGGNETVLEESL